MIIFSLSFILLIILIGIKPKPIQTYELFNKVPIKIINKYKNNFDIVITWVDWSNKYFIKEMNKHGGYSQPTEYGEFKELKYLIRSLIKHNIHYRNIYIVYSDNHPPPKYLVKNDQRLVFIKHSQIAKNKNDIPLMHRETIIINLHRIPGLLENYFYVEDDMFIYNPNIFYKQLEFFENKKQIVFKTKIDETSPKDMSLWQLGRYNANNIFKKYTKHLNYMFWDDHNIWLFKKSIINEIEKKYTKYFNYTSSFQNRKISKNKILFYIGITNIYVNYLIYIKKFSPIMTPLLAHSIHTNSDKYQIKNNKISNNTLGRIKKDLNIYNNYMFGNIQGPGVSDEYHKIPEINRLVYKWLDKLYPNKSKFEI